jgi:hypothetical protein
LINFFFIFSIGFTLADEPVLQAILNDNDVPAPLQIQNARVPLQIQNARVPLKIQNAPVPLMIRNAPVPLMILNEPVPPKNQHESNVMNESIDPPPSNQDDYSLGWASTAFRTIREPKKKSVLKKASNSSTQSTMFKPAAVNPPEGMTASKQNQEPSFFSLVNSVQQLFGGGTTSNTSQAVPQEIYLSTGVGDDEMTYLFSGDKNNEIDDDLRTKAGEYFPDLADILRDEHEKEYIKNKKSDGDHVQKLKPRTDFVESIPDYTVEKLRNRRRLNTNTEHMREY